MRNSEYFIPKHQQWLNLTIRLKDMAKMRYEFDRDVTVDIARNVKTGVKYSADRYVRFTEEKLKSKEALIEKLRLKNAKMSDRNRKISHQLKVYIEVNFY